MFTFKIVRDDGTSEVAQGVRYRTSFGGDVSASGSSDSTFLSILDSAGDRLEILEVRRPTAPGGILDIYVMNDAGKTIDHIH